MPTPQEIEAYLNRTGQGFTQAGQNMINQNVDQPVQQRLNALNQVANPQIGSPNGSLPSSQSAGMADPGEQTLPNAPTMSPADAQNRMSAAIQAGPAMQQAAAKLRAQAALDQQAEDHANQIGDIDMSKYQPYQPQALAPRQFPHIQAKMKSGQPVTTEDIRATMKPGQALSEDQEAALNKQLHGDDDENEDGKNTRSATKDTGTLGGV